MITKDNKAIERFSEEHTHRIRIKDYYPDDCSEQEFTLVNDETLAELEQMKRDVVSKKKWEKRHRAGSLYIDDEDFIATLLVDPRIRPASQAPLRSRRLERRASSRP